jgi:hypothetical protein
MTQMQGGREVSDAAIRTYVLQQQVAVKIHFLGTVWNVFS